MHAPPAVSYPVGPGRVLGGGFIALSAMCHGVWALLCYQMGSVFGWPQGVVLFASCAASVLAWKAWQRWPVGRVRWGGQTWGWELPASDVQGRVAVALDLQTCLLLSWQPLWPEGSDRSKLQAVWLWAERSSSPGDWLAFRRAAYARVALASGLVGDLQPSNGLRAAP